MTVIAGFLHGNTPVLLGDLLVSADVISEGQVCVLPTIGPAYQETFQSGTRSPVGLNQKVILLSSKLAIAWAGNAHKAKCFLERLIQLEMHEDPCRITIEGLFDRTTDGDVSVIGIMQGQLFSLGPCCRLSLQGAEECVAAGSGSVELADASAMWARMRSNGHSANEAVPTAISMISWLLMREFSDIEVLRQGFGAGYEIALWENGACRKFDDLTYVVWMLEKTLAGIELKGVVALKCTYEGSALLIMRSALNPTWESTHLVSPIHLAFNSSDFTDRRDATISSRNTCNMFVMLAPSCRQPGHVRTKITTVGIREELLYWEDVRITGINRPALANVVLSDLPPGVIPNLVIPEELP